MNERIPLAEVIPFDRGQEVVDRYLPGKRFSALVKRTDGKGVVDILVTKDHEEYWVETDNQGCVARLVYVKREDGF